MKCSGSEITIARRCSKPGDPDARDTVVWLRGEHDIATEAPLVAAITRAARRRDADVLVDLSDVTFMDASTLGALVGSRNRLLTHSQSLRLRAPSPPARRLLELCDLADLVLPAGGEVVDPRMGQLNGPGPA